MDKRVRETYTKDSEATLLSKLSDPYVKAFRLASDRIRTTGGVVAYITNNSYIDQTAFDGMRKHLARGFSSIHIIDLGGNVRKNPKLSGTTHNVFGIQVGVAITILVKHVHVEDKADRQAVWYTRMPENWRKGQKTAQLDEWKTLAGASWTELKPDERNNWLTEGQQSDFFDFASLGVNVRTPLSICHSRTLGISTNRDAYVYGSDMNALIERVKIFAGKYNSEVQRYATSQRPKDVDKFVSYEDIKWSRNLKRHLIKGDRAVFSKENIRESLYRPFTKKFVYLQDVFVDEPSKSGEWAKEESQVFICVSGIASAQHFQVLATNRSASLDLLEKTQCFPFYTYAEDGNQCEENITDWALTQYQTHYADPSITKWDIFHSTYALLHHSEYRTRYAANLKRELPRIPFPPDLHAFAAAGKRLMELHIDYEQQPEYKLEEVDNREVPYTLRVERMRLNKDKTELRYNEALTLRGIPPEVYTYRLGNRSALEWVIDQYRVTTDARSGIVNDPNRSDDESYILRLIKQVIAVSLETQRIIAALPSLNFPAD